MAQRVQVETAAGRVRVVFTGRADGDFRVGRPALELATLRRDLLGREIVDPAIAAQPWTWLQQVHGAEVVFVDQAGDGAGSEADAAVTIAPYAPLAVTTADCAPVVLVAERGFAVIHAGWRGLVSGVIDRAAAALADIGGEPVASLIGPSITSGAYEFGADDLDDAVAALGPEVRATTRWGSPALDVPRAVELVCRRLGWPDPSGPPACTSDPRWFSHRTRGDTGRQTTVAWLEPGARIPPPSDRSEGPASPAGG